MTYAVTTAEVLQRQNEETAREQSPLAQAEWPQPKPLTMAIACEAYPKDALPTVIREAVLEVESFVKAPLPLVANSALAAISLACQGHCDVERASKLDGPTGLFMLTIAESGERKSTCDGYFFDPIRAYERQQTEIMEPAQADYRADLASWEAKAIGIREQLKTKSQQGPVESLETDLRKLENCRPKGPKTPRLIYADATPEALASGIANHWPSAGVISSEAGVVFGGHAMSSDSVMRNLAQLNQLWDGNELTVDRRTKESFRARGRLTVALQVQEGTLKAFLAKSGSLARDIGFMARFLIAWPVSTQGTRFFTDPPDKWPALEHFHGRLRAVLDKPLPLDQFDDLSPKMMVFSPDAKALWIQFHDSIEMALASGGDLHDVRDVASKTADNAARIAGLFQYFDDGGVTISADAFNRASRIVEWHLSESRRLFGQTSLSQELMDATKLDAWLIRNCKQEGKRSVSSRELQQYGPVRDKQRLHTALQELVELDRVFLVYSGKRKDIHVNAHLLVGA